MDARIGYLKRFLVALGKEILAAPVRPRAVVLVSAHWETAPGLRNFPAHFYDIKYPAARAPDAAKASGLLNAAEFNVADETERLDYGDFTIRLYLIKRGTGANARDPQGKNCAVSFATKTKGASTGLACVQWKRRTNRHWAFLITHCPSQSKLGKTGGEK
ncbi:hypothetical protein DFJ73DRAFT_963244 [Zopfochytrium polystomum]|nr:hypothetical protein DFJ73DRAFT_963244 [Zopfochytrium polystomum]